MYSCVQMVLRCFWPDRRSTRTGAVAPSPHPTDPRSRRSSARRCPQGAGARLDARRRLACFKCMALGRHWYGLTLYERSLWALLYAVYGLCFCVKMVSRCFLSDRSAVHIFLFDRVTFLTLRSVGRVFFFGRTESLSDSIIFHTNEQAVNRVAQRKKEKKADMIARL